MPLKLFLFRSTANIVAKYHLLSSLLEMQMFEHAIVTDRNNSWTTLLSNGCNTLRKSTSKSRCGDRLVLLMKILTGNNDDDEVGLRGRSQRDKDCDKPTSVRFCTRLEREDSVAAASPSSTSLLQAKRITPSRHCDDFWRRQRRSFVPWTCRRTSSRCRRPPPIHDPPPHHHHHRHRELQRASWKRKHVLEFIRATSQLHGVNPTRNQGRN